MIAAVIGTLVSLSCLFFWLSCEAIIAANRYPGSAAASAGPTVIPFVDIDLSGYASVRDRLKPAEPLLKPRASLSQQELGQLTAELRGELQGLDTASLDFDFSDPGQSASSA